MFYTLIQVQDYILSYQLCIGEEDRAVCTNAILKSVLETNDVWISEQNQVDSTEWYGKTQRSDKGKEKEWQ